MKLINPYAALMMHRQLKKQFIKDLSDLLQQDKAIFPKGKLCFISYSELINWDVEPLFDPKKMGEAEAALMDKIKHMLLIKDNDLGSVIRMLHSFRHGVKKHLKYRDYEDLYEYVSKDGNDKYSHGQNLKKGHFRWNFDKRYVLSGSSVRKITLFVDEILNS